MYQEDMLMRWARLFNKRDMRHCVILYNFYKRFYVKIVLCNYTWSRVITLYHMTWFNSSVLKKMLCNITVFVLQEYIQNMYELFNFIEMLSSIVDIMDINNIIILLYESGPLQQEFSLNIFVFRIFHYSNIIFDFVYI